ncbi:Myb DNA-bind domain-containing protein [Salix suchowensis]|nr:Myb DNA-bind domain-containing protein [Salix suchowensis]
MSLTQDEKCKGKGKHFKWTKPMSNMLLELLADEALKGNKPSSTFKAESFVKVATEINAIFNVQCEPKHVENHLRTVKKEWGIITTLRGKSGFGWDDCLKMITVSKDVYAEEVKAHPNHDKYLNKKLDFYDEMTLVVGKDMATGNFAKSFADVNLEENTEVHSISMENEVEYEETSKGKGTSSSATQKRQHRKRSRMHENDDDDKFSKQIGDVVCAIQSISKNQLDVSVLYEAVMEVEGFDEITLVCAFDYLVQNEMLAKAFLVKRADLRKFWVQNFVTTHYNRSAS